MATQSDCSGYRAPSTASDALRALADWLDAHPDVPTDGYRMVHLHTIVNSEHFDGAIADEGAAIAAVEQFARTYADGYVNEEDMTTSANARIPCGSAAVQVFVSAMHKSRKNRRKVS